ncbi:Oleate activated transcription factor 3 [Penicillium soppii]|uniref:Oleate activated transcription factor 3 n=1 Tax=Penicillium soppii TaxID=69789 RepID=UPI002549A40E|nr:Oleate activated transcription factor 3 [Penicillium soppii]KAJ5865318.1 Oleate activated transcription factor 3 [Penicillium soppii]
MDRVPISSQRVFKPSAKKRRPPLACIQCYQRKLKCGRELPSCSRCSKAGNDGCTYRGNPAKFPSVNGVLNDGHSGSTSVVTTSSPTPVSSTATSGKPRASSDCNGKMTHLKGQGTITKFYGYSYPLNLYQQFAELQSYIVQIKTKNPGDQHPS